MNELLNFINLSLEKCDRSYQIILYTISNEDDLFRMIDKKSNKCHNISRDFRELIGDNTVELYVMLALDGNEIASYLAFSIEESESAGGENFIMIKMSCTDIDFRRRGLSVLLRMVPLFFAAAQNIQFIASDANKESGELLKKKFGFTITEDYLEQFNYDANSYVDIKSAAAEKMINKYYKDLCSVTK